MFAIVDVETTGNHRGADRIIEIAIIVSDGKQIIHEFQSLVNPEKSINPFVEKLTGITESMVKDAPRFSDIAQQVYEMLHGKNFVAHNASFDYSLVEAELASCGIAFNAPQIDTINYAKRIFRDIASYSLGNLCDSIGIPHGDRHRAYGDTLATATLFHMLRERDENDLTLKALLQHGLDDSCLPEKLNKEKILSLPPVPGVIRFFTESGELVLLDAAKNIRKKSIDKVLTLFNDHTSRATFNLIADVDFTPTGTELIAKIKKETELQKGKPLIGKKVRPFVASHALVLEQNSIGINIIKPKHVSETNGNPHIAFPSRTYANRTLDKIMTNGNFHSGYQSILAEQNPQVKLARQTEYNIRIQRALLSSIYQYPNMIVIDKGTSKDEHSVIWIDNGQFMGYGFIATDENITRENVAEFVTHYPENPEIRKAIRNYISKNRVVKLIKY